MVIKEFAFIGYPFTDVDRARGFYEGILGLKADMAEQFDGENGQKQWWIEYDINGVTLALSNTWPPSGEGGPSAALEVDDLDEWRKMLQEKNVPFVFDTMDTPVCRFICIQDPDKNCLVIHQRKCCGEEGCNC